jgi:hypothetical protein
MITIRQSIWINQSKTRVWDFTQNYELRKVWDDSVVSAELVQSQAPRKVRLKLKGSTTLLFVYKLDNKPHKSSLNAIDIQSPYLLKAGGSWSYEEKNGGTQWTQVNTLILKKIYALLFKSIIRMLFNYQTRKAMLKAKHLLESGTY